MIQDINEDATVASVRECFERYNTALDAGDADTLNGFFWVSPATVRFGAAETLFGYDEISTFRSKKWKRAARERVIEKVVITAFGPDVATTNAVSRSSDGTGSRVSQTWVHLAEGWRIVSAHVSAAP